MPGRYDRVILFHGASDTDSEEGDRGLRRDSESRRIVGTRL